MCVEVLLEYSMCAKCNFRAALDVVCTQEMEFGARNNDSDIKHATCRLALSALTVCYLVIVPYVKIP